MQFIVDAPVAGLNYSCSVNGVTVNDVTTATGIATCPLSSVATFFIQASGGTRQITLGNYLVKTIPVLNSGAANPNNLLTVTPVDLVPSAAAATSLTDSVAAGAVNIAQLLETLRSTSFPYIATEPTSRLVLDSTTTAQLDKSLTTDIASADIISGVFANETQFKTLLSNLNRTLVSTADTTTRFTQGLQAIQAGSYWSSPLVIITLSSTTNNAASTATLASASDPNDQALLGLFNVIDRSGNNIGQGVEWNGSILPTSSSTSNTSTAYNLITGSTPTRLQLPTVGSSVTSPSFINPVSNYVIPANFAWVPTAYALDASGNWIVDTSHVTNLGTTSFSNGRLLAGTYIVGSSQLWQNATGNAATVTPPTNELATWSQTVSGSSHYQGNVTITKVRSVDTFLDPSVYTTANNVGHGNTAVFPLYATLTFKYTNSTNCTTGCVLGTQGIAILANGNIITDMKQECSAVDPTSYKNANSTQQYPIGIVGAAFDGITNLSDRFISPIISLSGSQFGVLNGLQMGTLGLAPSSKINVVGVPSGNISITDNTNTYSTQNGVTTVTQTGEQSTAAANYANAYDVWSSLKTSPSTGDKIAIARSAGTVTIALSKCYVPPVGN